MLIEDDALVRTLIAHRAMDSHWRVTTLKDGRELERMMRDEPVDLLLIDLGAGKNRLGGSTLAQVYNQMGRTAPDLDAPVETRPIGGLGIHFLRTLMDDLCYRRENERNRLCFKKLLPQEGTAA